MTAAVPDLAAPPDAAARWSPAALVRLAIKARALIALALVLAYFAAVAPNFLSVANLLIMAKHIAIVAILAIGMTFVILTGGIDLSVGSIVGLAGMVAGSLVLNGIGLGPTGLFAFPSALGIAVIVVAVGAAIGLANGLLVTRLSVAPFIATLGTLYVVRGAALLMSGGSTFANLGGDPAFGNQGFPTIGAGRLGGVPVPVLLLVVLAIAATVLAARTPFGRRLYAIGGNERAALLSGVRVGRVKTAAYMLSGACAALVGLIVASDLVAAHPASGTTFELSAIAAVVLGGASLAGGRGTIGGALIGACVIGTLGDGMVMTGVSEFWQMVIKGAVIVAAVVLDQAQQRLGRTGAR